jgi:hypothetical protein
MDSRLITVIVPEKIYEWLHAKKRRDGSTIQHQVNAILAFHYSKVKKTAAKP